MAVPGIPTVRETGSLQKMKRGGRSWDWRGWKFMLFLAAAFAVAMTSITMSIAYILQLRSMRKQDEVSEMNHETTTSMPMSNGSAATRISERRSTTNDRALTRRTAYFERFECRRAGKPGFSHPANPRRSMMLTPVCLAFHRSCFCSDTGNPVSPPVQSKNKNKGVIHDIAFSIHRCLIAATPSEVAAATGRLGRAHLVWRRLQS